MNAKMVHWKTRWNFRLVVWASLSSAALAAGAERENESRQAESVELTALRARVETLETEVVSLRAQYAEQLGALETQMRELRGSLASSLSTPTPGPVSPEDQALSEEERASLDEELAKILGEGLEEGGETPAAPVQTTGSQREFSGRSRRLNALNPEISVTGDMFGIVADRSGDPDTNRFTFDEFELALQAPLDPFSLGKAFIVHEGGEFAVEEVYIDFTSLPGGLGLKIGRFRHDWGKLNRWHQHALPQVDRPLVHRAVYGEEGLAGLGVSMSWLPRPFLGSYNELWVQVTNDDNDVAFSGRGFDDPVFVLHETNYWDLSPATYLELGVSASTGKNDILGQFRTQVYGVDWNLNWTPPERSLYSGFDIRGEVMFRTKEKDAGREDIMGVYTYGTFKLGRRWNVGLRGDWTEIPDAPGQSLWGVSPYLEWWQSEWTQWRIQYTYNSRRLEEPDESENRLFFQIVWSLGPHKHEKY